MIIKLYENFPATNEQLMKCNVSRAVNKEKHFMLSRTEKGPLSVLLDDRYQEHQIAYGAWGMQLDHTYHICQSV